MLAPSISPGVGGQPSPVASFATRGGHPTRRRDEFGAAGPRAAISRVHLLYSVRIADRERQTGSADCGPECEGAPPAGLGLPGNRCAIRFARRAEAPRSAAAPVSRPGVPSPGSAAFASFVNCGATGTTFRQSSASKQDWFGCQCSTRDAHRRPGASGS